MRSGKVRNDIEHKEQVKLFEWAKLQSAKHPQLTMMFAIPNGSNKSMAQAVKFKAEGLKAGVPDIFLAIPIGGSYGLFIEMKSPKGKLSENQKEWIALLLSSGYKCAVCYSFDEAKKVITEYLGI